jgi:hypothetical protein
MSHQHIPGMPEHEIEPVPGLPERLPPGEGIIWQGSPAWWPFARRALHLKGLGIYFLVLVAWHLVESMMAGGTLLAALSGPSVSVVLASLCLVILGVIGRASARATLYTITNRRIVLRVGVALPMTINIPYSAVQSASVKRHADGTEDIVLALLPEHRVSMVALWPHLRPWRMGRPEPMLRGLPVTAGASQVLARALAASAQMAVPAAQDEPRRRPVRLPGEAVA